jgi:hypothetical protein
VARRRLYNLPFYVLECDGCSTRSPLDVPPDRLDDWLVVDAAGGATHLCPECNGAVSPRRIGKPPVGDRRAAAD